VTPLMLVFFFSYFLFFFSFFLSFFFLFFFFSSFFFFCLFLYFSLSLSLLFLFLFCMLLLFSLSLLYSLSSSLSVPFSPYCTIPLHSVYVQIYTVNLFHVGRGSARPPPRMPYIHHPRHHLRRPGAYRSWLWSNAVHARASLRLLLSAAKMVLAWLAAPHLTGLQ
jgi:hypothetical protein